LIGTGDDASEGGEEANVESATVEKFLVSVIGVVNETRKDEREQEKCEPTTKVTEL